jgi:hypothetical protein
MTKMICPKCMGNGYRMIYKDASWTEKVAIDCEYCENQGEVDITEDTLKDVGKDSEEGLKEMTNKARSIC